MRVLFTPEVSVDYQFWLEADRAMLGGVNSLIESACRSPLSGIDKPEPLRGELAGLWSRRIDREHRLLHRVEGRGDQQAMVVIACRFHFGRA